MIPFLKWAGGKRQLLDKIKGNLPQRFNNYYEPFVGGGAVFLELAHPNTIINDINCELIHTYKAIQNNPNELIAQIKAYDAVPCNKDFYFQMRSLYNQKISDKKYDIELAALFIWLNKHCFNGLYRVNQKGEFNVPYNGIGNISSINEDNLVKISKYLQSVTILNQDFEDVCNTARDGDFVFFDSPYDNSFAQYTQTGFTMDDHKRLAKLFHELSNKGCYCMLTNHGTTFIRDLYSEFNIQDVLVRRSINRYGDNRTGSEVIICNYNH